MIHHNYITINYSKVSEIILQLHVIEYNYVYELRREQNART